MARVQPFSRRTVVKLCSYGSACAILVCLSAPLQAQVGPILGLPFIGTGSADSVFSQIDFAETYMDTANKEQQKNAEQRAQRQHQVDIGAISALDLNASDKAIQEFNRATTLMKAQQSKKAIEHLEKAIKAYPKFVSAYNSLGLAYLDQGDNRARSEFETAAKLDEKFPGSFLNLGMLSLSLNDFASAQTQLERAASFSSKNPRILMALAYAQNGNHQYAEVLQTAQQVHALEHKGMANVHYVAAAAAIALNNTTVAQHELTLFLAEDPTNPFAPVARRNLDILSRPKNTTVQVATQQPDSTMLGSRAVQTFPNSERLQAQLNALPEESENASCETCKAAAEANTTETASVSPPSAAPFAPSIRSSGVYTIRETVDETALFFAVSSRGHMVNDLELSDLQIRDNDKPPQKILQFIPQSKLPLRIGLLVDTSGSVQDRFSFEKGAARKFLQKVLNGTSDLGFAAGFSTETVITQDFTANPMELGKGIDQLKNGGGTALFDAVSLACWKLAAYPEEERVAKVLVVLSDGEDNSSRRSLRQAILEAESSGVTIYTVSTREDIGPKTDADRILSELAERSGGEALFPGDFMSLDKSLDKLRDLIRSRYLVAYKPADFLPNGKYRTIHLIAEKDHKHLQVHVRKGYYARLESPAATN